uniref:Uncharacterized protein n=1 Tax=Accipiter nisus TaxID=211598 RepID=A0A8B9MLJ8_9AVES
MPVLRDGAERGGAAARVWRVPWGECGGRGSPWAGVSPPPPTLPFISASPPPPLPQESGTPRRKAVQAMGPRASAGQAEAQQLQELRSRTERAERRLLACENLVGELGSNLAALGSLLQEYGQLQQRLENMENLLKNRNFWILRLPPGHPTCFWMIWAVRYSPPKAVSWA